MSGRTILVTGASRGFGRLATTRLAKDGWRVFATMRDPSRRGELDAGLRAVGVDPTSVDVRALDVRDQANVHRVTQEVVRATGGTLDAALCNAGIIAAGAFEETPPEVVRDVIETNVFGTFETARAALPALRASGDGRLLVISSDSGLVGTPALATYTASKFALEGWAESVAYEVGPLGVKVSLIEPGAFATAILDVALHHDPRGPYGGLARGMEASVADLVSTAPDPAPVIETILAALNSPRPRLRYPVGRDARLVSAAKGILPDRWRAALVRRQTRLSSWKPLA